MNDLMEELTSLRFWIAVVLVGILINLAAAYLKPVFDRLLSRVSGAYRQTLARREASYHAVFQALLSSEELRHAYRAQSVLERVRSAWFISFGIGAYLIGLSLQSMSMEAVLPFSVAAYLGGTFSIVLSMTYVHSSSKKWDVSWAASQKAAGSEIR